MIEQAFEVATEWRFDVGQALLSSSKLQDSVDGISKSVDGAMTGLNYLASGLVARLGFGSGGIIGLFTKAVEVSEAFNDSALNFSNNIMSNMRVLTGTIGTFNDRLGTSEMIMSKIMTKANSLGLGADDLSKMTQLLATPLAIHGKLGKDYAGAINMAGNLGVASQAVGLNPGISAEMLSRAITDHMAIHGALFARLVNTPAFRGNHVITQPQLMMMNPDKKIDLLTKALSQLAGDADFLAFRLQSLGSMFNIFKNRIEEFLKPIGDAIEVPLKKLFGAINDYLGKYGKQLGETIGKLIGSLLADPKRLFVNLMQLKNVGNDLHKAFSAASLIQIGLMVSSVGPMILKFLRAMGLLNGALLEFLQGMGVQIVFFAKKLMNMEVIGTILRFIGAALAEFGILLLGFFGMFQLLSRAKAIAHEQDLAAIGRTLPAFATGTLRVKNALIAIETPFELLFNRLAMMLAPIFRASSWLDILTWGIDKFAKVLEFVANIITKVAAFASSLLMVFGNLHGAGGAQGLIHPFKGFVDNYDKFIKENGLRVDDAEKAASKSTVINNNHVEARFDMREQMEPDRIAFAVTEHLKKLVINPTQARGHSIHAGFAGATLAPAPGG